jgi:hypothetical protein
MIDSDGNIVTQDLSRLNDDELAAVEYNLVTRNRLLQPNQIAQAVAAKMAAGKGGVPGAMPGIGEPPASGGSKLVVP